MASPEIEAERHDVIVTLEKALMKSNVGIGLRDHVKEQLDRMWVERDARAERRRMVKSAVQQTLYEALGKTSIKAQGEPARGSYTNAPEYFAMKCMVALDTILDQLADRTWSPDTDD